MSMPALSLFNEGESNLSRDSLDQVTQFLKSSIIPSCSSAITEKQLGASILLQLTTQRGYLRNILDCVRFVLSNKIETPIPKDISLQLLEWFFVSEKHETNNNNNENNQNYKNTNNNNVNQSDFNLDSCIKLLSNDKESDIFLKEFIETKIKRGGNEEDSQPQLLDVVIAILAFIDRISSSYLPDTMATKQVNKSSEPTSVYMWGSDSNGQLVNIASSTSVNEPTFCSAISSHNPIQIELGSHCTTILSEDGMVYACGKGEYGRLGVGSTESKTSLTPLTVFKEQFIRKIATSRNSYGHGLAIDGNNEIWSWGDGDYGKLGHGDTSQCNVPKKIAALADKHIIDISCGHKHSACVTMEGEVYTWGLGDYGRLGHGNSDNSRVPKLVRFDEPIRSVSCGNSHTMALSQSNEIVWSWGDGDHGKLGHGDTTVARKPEIIAALSEIGSQIIKIECGDEISMALTNEGRLYSWGKSELHGHESSSGSHVTTPKLLKSLEAWTIVDMCAGGHCIALASNGDVFTWGRGEGGPLGHGNSSNVEIPTLVSQLQGRGIKQVAAGSQHSVAWTIPPLDRQSQSSIRGVESAPYCIDLHPNTFHTLREILQEYATDFSKTTKPFKNFEEQQYLIIACLNILRTNLFHVTIVGSDTKELGLSCSSENLMFFRDQLLRLLNSCDAPRVQQAVQKTFEVGWGVLLPTSQERRIMLSSLLPHISKTSSSSSSLDNNNNNTASKSPYNFSISQYFLMDLLVNSLLDDHNIIELPQLVPSNNLEIPISVINDDHIQLHFDLNNSILSSSSDSSSSSSQENHQFIISFIDTNKDNTLVITINPNDKNKKNDTNNNNQSSHSLSISSKYDSNSNTISFNDLNIKFSFFIHENSIDIHMVDQVDEKITIYGCFTEVELIQFSGIGKVISVSQVNSLLPPPQEHTELLLTLLRCIENQTDSKISQLLQDDDNNNNKKEEPSSSSDESINKTSDKDDNLLSEKNQSNKALMSYLKYLQKHLLRLFGSTESSELEVLVFQHSGRCLGYPQKVISLVLEYGIALITHCTRIVQTSIKVASIKTSKESHKKLIQILQEHSVLCSMVPQFFLSLQIAHNLHDKISSSPSFLTIFNTLTNHLYELLDHIDKLNHILPTHIVEHEELKWNKNSSSSSSTKKSENEKEKEKTTVNSSSPPSDNTEEDSPPSATSNSDQIDNSDSNENKNETTNSTATTSSSLMDDENDFGNQFLWIVNVERLLASLLGSWVFRCISGCHVALSSSTSKLLYHFYLIENQNENQIQFIDKIIEGNPKIIFDQLNKLNEPSERLHKFTRTCFALLLKFYNKLNDFEEQQQNDNHNDDLSNEILRIWEFACFFADQIKEYIPNTDNENDKLNFIDEKIERAEFIAKYLGYYNDNSNSIIIEEEINDIISSSKKKKTKNSNNHSEEIKTNNNVKKSENTNTKSDSNDENCNMVENFDNLSESDLKLGENCRILLFNFTKEELNNHLKIMNKSIQSRLDCLQLLCGLISRTELLRSVQLQILRNCFMPSNEYFGDLNKFVNEECSLYKKSIIQSEIDKMYKCLIQLMKKAIDGVEQSNQIQEKGEHLWVLLYILRILGTNHFTISAIQAGVLPVLYKLLVSSHKSLKEIQSASINYLRILLASVVTNNEISIENCKPVFELHRKLISESITSNAIQLIEGGGSSGETSEEKNPLDSNASTCLPLSTIVGFLCSFSVIPKVQKCTSSPEWFDLWLKIISSASLPDRLMTILILKENLLSQDISSVNKPEIHTILNKLFDCLVSSYNIDDAPEINMFNEYEKNEKIITDGCSLNRKLLHKATIEGNDRTFRQSRAAEIHNTGYVVGTTGASSGIHRWTLQSHHDARSDETLCVGVASMPIGNTNLENTGSMWLYRAYNGALYHSGKCGLLEPFTIGDIIDMEVNMDKRTLSYYKNGKHLGEAYSDLPELVFPVILFYATSTRARASFIKYTYQKSNSDEYKTRIPYTTSQAAFRTEMNYLIRELLISSSWNNYVQNFLLSKILSNENPQDLLVDQHHHHSDLHSNDFEQIAAIQLIGDNECEFFRIGSRVHHDNLGLGTVIDLFPSMIPCITISYDSGTIMVTPTSSVRIEPGKNFSLPHFNISIQKAFSSIVTSLCSAEESSNLLISSNRAIRKFLNINKNNNKQKQNQQQQQQQQQLQLSSSNNEISIHDDHFNDNDHHDDDHDLNFVNIYDESLLLQLFDTFLPIALGMTSLRGVYSSYQLEQIIIHCRVLIEDTKSEKPESEQEIKSKQNTQQQQQEEITKEQEKQTEEEEEEEKEEEKEKDEAQESSSSPQQPTSSDTTTTSTPQPPIIEEVVVDPKTSQDVSEREENKERETVETVFSKFLWTKDKASQKDKDIYDSLSKKSLKQRLESKNHIDMAKDDFVKTIEKCTSREVIRPLVSDYLLPALQIILARELIIDLFHYWKSNQMNLILKYSNELNILFKLVASGRVSGYSSSIIQKIFNQLSNHMMNNTDDNNDELVNQFFEFTKVSQELENLYSSDFLIPLHFDCFVHTIPSFEYIYCCIQTFSKVPISFLIRLIECVDTKLPQLLKSSLLHVSCKLIHKMKQFNCTELSKQMTNNQSIQKLPQITNSIYESLGGFSNKKNIFTCSPILQSLLGIMLLSPIQWNLDQDNLTNQTPDDNSTTTSNSTTSSAPTDADSTNKSTSSSSTSANKWKWFYDLKCAIQSAHALKFRNNFSDEFINECKNDILLCSSTSITNDDNTNKETTEGEDSSSTTSSTTIKNKTTDEVHDNDDDSWMNNQFWSKKMDHELVSWTTEYPGDWSCPIDVYLSGCSQSGQLAEGTGSHKNIPVAVESMALLQPKQVMCGSMCTIVLAEDGTIHSCGKGEYGRLGTGSNENQYSLIQLPSIQNVVMKQISVSKGSYGHALAIDETGGIWSWGDGDYGKLGHGNTTPCNKPKLIESLRRNIISVSCGFKHSACITSDGELYTWGMGDYGRLGHGDSNDSHNSPKFVEKFSGQHVIQVSCGSSHTLALTDDNIAWSWGDGDYGKLGHGDTNTKTIPTKIEMLSSNQIKKLDTGEEFSLCLTENGRVLTWGRYTSNVLGHGEDGNLHVPLIINALEDSQIIDAVAGASHCLALTKTNIVYAWGNNEEGQLGLGHKNPVLLPQVIDSLKNRNIRQISAGSSHSAFWTTELNDRHLVSMSLPNSIPIQYKNIQNISLSLITKRITVLQHFSDQILSYLQFCDYDEMKEILDLDEIHLFLLSKSKRNVFRKQLSKTAFFDGDTTIQLDHCIHDIFTATFLQLSTLDPKELRGSFRPYRIRIDGDIVEEYDGIQEECMEQLQMGSCGLLIPTSNALHKIGINQDVYMFSEDHIHPKRFKFRFLGRLIGISIRTKLPLKLHLAFAAFKLLSASKLNINDLKSIDITFINNLMKINPSLFIDDQEDNSTTCDSSDSPPSSSGFDWSSFISSIPSHQCLSDLYPPIVSDIDGTIIELNENSRCKYADLALNQRLKAWDLQASWIREGIRDIIPVGLFSVLTGRDLQEYVSAPYSTSDSSIWDDLSKSCTYINFPTTTSTTESSSTPNTDSSTTDATNTDVSSDSAADKSTSSDDKDKDSSDSNESSLHPTLKWFWKSIEKLTPHEKILFCQFVAGTTRPFFEKLTITFYPNDTDGSPITCPTTCSISLPNYSSEKELDMQIHKAIHAITP